MLLWNFGESVPPTKLSIIALLGLFHIKMDHKWKFCNPPSQILLIFCMLSRTNKFSRLEVITFQNYANFCHF